MENLDRQIDSTFRRSAVGQVVAMTRPGLVCSSQPKAQNELVVTISIGKNEANRRACDVTIATFDDDFPSSKKRSQRAGNWITEMLDFQNEPNVQAFDEAGEKRTQSTILVDWVRDSDIFFGREVIEVT